MQNVTLPDRGEVKAVLAETAGGEFTGWRMFGGSLRPESLLLVAWVRALYAKHGEVCPLFGEDEK